MIKRLKKLFRKSQVTIPHDPLSKAAEVPVLARVARARSGAEILLTPYIDERGNLCVALKVGEDTHSTVMLGLQFRDWSVDDVLGRKEVQRLLETMEDLAAVASPVNASEDGPRTSGDSVARRLGIVAIVMSFLSIGVSLFAIVLSLASKSFDSAESFDEFAPVTSQTGEAGEPLRPVSLSPSALAVLKDVVARSGFSLNPNGQPVVMFADPNCAACREFEGWIAADQYKTFSPLVVPVAFRSGSREAAAAVLCAKDQAKAWADAVAGKPGEACEDGLKQIDINNAAFQAMGLTYTPTFVALNGALKERVASPQEMRSWADQNSSTLSQEPNNNKN